MASRKNFDKQTRVLNDLQNAFRNHLEHLEIIQAVAESQNYDFQKSSSILKEMISNKDNRSSKSTNNNNKSRRQQSTNNTPKKTQNQHQHQQQQQQQQNYRLQSSASSNAIAAKSKKAERIDLAIDQIQKGYKVLILLRGLPGSGKSHLAQAIINSTIGNYGQNDQHILSTDDFFLHPRMGYVYDQNRLSDAHAWNHHRALKAMSCGVSPVIIDNTNVQMWEMKPYATMATDFGYIIYILEPDTWWSSNDKELAKRNNHNVPRQKIKEMLERYEKNVTAVKLLSAYNLTYKLKKPPQFRNIPPITMPTPTQMMNGYSNFSVPKNDVVKSKSFSGLNRQMSTDSNNSDAAIETINLMDFSETPQASYATVSSPPRGGILNPLDEILMCNDEDAGNILKPAQIQDQKNSTNDEAWGISEKALNSWQMVDSQSTFNIENAWGVNEEALHSWDIVTPIKQPQDESSSSTSTITKEDGEVAKKIETIENSSNVDQTDLNYFFGNTNNLPDGIRIILTKNRDINEGLPIKSLETVPKKLMLHKSCSTDDYDNGTDDNREDLIKLRELKELFPRIPLAYLKEIFEKCNKNFNWTVDLLLEDKNLVHFEGIIADDDDDDENSTNDNNQNSNEDNDDDDDIEIAEESKEKSFKKKSISEESENLKRLIEGKIDINREHYSKHLLKVKTQKFGGNSIDDPQPSTSGISAPAEFSSEYDYEMQDDNPKQLVELTLGDILVEQLELKFNNGSNLLPQGFQPVVEVPIDLARQLYMLYIESVCRQMDAQNDILEQLEKEDEEFARKLQDKLNLPPMPEPSMNLSEIMEEQAVANLYKKESEQWKSMTADTLAARLTRQKLFETFPSIDRNSLLEILHAYNNDYKKTVEDLCNSIGMDNTNGQIEAIKEPPLSPNTIEEMKEAEEISKEIQDDENNQPADYYRDKASKHLGNRQLLYQKAQSYYQKGMTEVAMFYSELAKKETQHYDHANHIAAHTYLNEHSKRLQKFDTIDLHYLYVKEAIPALDLFIDQNINLLSTGKKQVQDLYVITGRGNRSEGGRAKIRPAIIARLKKRQIPFVQINPGLLKIKVGKYSSVTSSLT